MQPLNQWRHKFGLLGNGYDRDLWGGRGQTMGLICRAGTKRAPDVIDIGMGGVMGGQGNVAEHEHQHQCHTLMAQGKGS